MVSSRMTSKSSGETSRLKYVERMVNLVKEAFNTMNFNSRFKESYYMEVSVRHMKKNLRYCLKIFMILWYGLIGFNLLFSPSSPISLIADLFCLIFIVFCYFLTIYMKRSGQIQILTVGMILVVKAFNIFNLYNSFNLPEVNFTPTLQICLLIFSNLFLKLHISIIFWLVSYGMLLMTVIVNVHYKARMSNFTFLLPYGSVYILSRLPKFDKGVRLERYFVGLVVLGSGITLMSMYIFFVNNIRRRAAFLRLGHNVQIKHQIRTAMKSQLRWIDAIMPEVIKNEYVEHNEEIKLDKWVFVKNFDNVSILFADIVGFTNICSKKCASDVVKLLNDLFNRFDELSSLTNCEKLGTLGDCYYCVAGCPISRPDHAVSCIEMGLGMCKIIKQFNEDYNEDVNMRVGVHTGRVNAAVIGKNRFRFDVYSNDVIIANTMESSGKPGFVHISQSVYAHVRLLYKVENGEDLEIKMEKEQGIAGTLLQSTFIKTYFIDPKSPQMLYDEKIFERKDNLRVLIQHKSSESKDSMLEDIVKADNVDYERDFLSNRDTLAADTKFIESLKFDPDKQIRFFIYPPLNIFTLMFIDKEIEWNFNTVIRSDPGKITFDSMKLTPLLDCLGCILYSTLVYIALYIIFPKITWKEKAIIILNIATSIVFSIINVWLSFGLNYHLRYKFLKISLHIISNPFVRSLICFYFLSSPLIVIILILNDCSRFYIDYAFTTRYFTLIIFSLFIAPLFLSTHYLVKIFVCCINVAIALLVVTWVPCRRINLSYTFPHYSCLGQLNITDIAFFRKVQYNFVFQILMTFFLMILVIRELEMNIRLLFYVTREAEIRKEEAAEAMKNAERLLYNIIPKYVFDQMAKSKDLVELNNLNYAMSIPKAAVAFACISNFFSKYYREDYKGGENALKLLHKIICYFDDIIKKEMYKDVEKIKTINDCYMVASGLNFKMLDRNAKNAHLYALMYYAFDMIKVLDYFNENFIIGSDKFQVKIGYNFGPITAGIIGATKPMYDIWGDTVNVASRMYSTGSPGLIQVPQHVVGELDSEFNFTYRGQIYVKGKGDMDTYVCNSSKSVEEKEQWTLDLVKTIRKVDSPLRLAPQVIQETVTFAQDQISVDAPISGENPLMKFKKVKTTSPAEISQYKLFLKKPIPPRLN